MGDAELGKTIEQPIKLSTTNNYSTNQYLAHPLTLGRVHNLRRF